MVITNTPIPAILIYKGVKLDKKITPIEPIPVLHNNNNNRSTNEQKKNDVKTAAAILRIHKQR